MSIKFENLVVGYQGVEPLSFPLTLTLNQPGIYGVIGPNGCGKSTLLKTMLGLLAPVKGGVLLLEKKVEVDTRLPEGVSYVPQTNGVNRYFNITVEQVVSQGFLSAVNKTKVRELLKEWDLENFSSHLFRELSIGQKTRVLIARSLASEPKILLLDEPLANLDMHCQRFLMTTLASLVHRSQMLILMVDHHFEKFRPEFRAFLSFHRGHEHDECHHHETRTSYIHFVQTERGEC